MKKIIVNMAVLLALATAAQAQEQCIEGAVNCVEIPDDPICVVQQQFGLQQTGECNRATAGALIGDGFTLYYQYRGVFPTDAKQNAFAICSRTGPIRKDGKCGWYRFEQATEATAPPAESDPIATIKARFDANAKKVSDADEVHCRAQEGEVAYRRNVEEGIGTRLPQSGVFATAVGVGMLNGEVLGRGELTLRVPFGPCSRVAAEFGVVGGYAGLRKDPLEVIFRGFIGPTARLAFRLSRHVKFLLGADWWRYFPQEDTDISTSDSVLAASGLLVETADGRFAFKCEVLAGGNLTRAPTGSDWIAASGFECSSILRW